METEEGFGFVETLLAGLAAPFLLLAFCVAEMMGPEKYEG